MLEISQLQAPGLDPQTLQLAPGECLGLHGPSGSGKTRLLRLIVDLDPHQGQVRLDGQPRESLPAHLWRRTVAYLPADSAWWLPRVVDHFPTSCTWSPERLGLPEAARDWNIERLSSGERQRLALLRLLCLQPKVLLLDEPTANLDPASTTQVEALVNDYRQQHPAAVLWVSHDQAQLERIADRRLELVGQGPDQGQHS